MFSKIRARTGPRLLVVAVLAALAAGCGATQEASGAGQPVSRAASATERVNLAGVCPSRIVIQTAWTPESTHGGLFQLLGKDFAVDTAKKRAIGRLVAHGGVDTGVELELRAGGPALNNQPIASLMKQDPSITLGQNSLEDGIGNATDLRTTAVFSPYFTDPVVFMWDPTRHPDWHNLNDIGQTDTKVITFRSAEIDFLVGAGILRLGQIDFSFDGAPDRLATDRSIVVGGFITNDPWTYAKLGIAVEHDFVSDRGYPNYRNQIVIRTADKPKLDQCLRRLVPVMQQAMADVAADPAPAMRAVADTAATYKLLPYSYEQAMYGAQTATCLGLIDIGPQQAFGETAPDRVQRMLDILRPIYAGGTPAGQTQKRTPLPADLTAGQLATNEYLDPSIKPVLTKGKGCPTP